MKKIKRWNLIVEFIMVVKATMWYYTIQCLDKAWQIFNNIKGIHVVKRTDFLLSRWEKAEKETT